MPFSISRLCCVDIRDVLVLEITGDTKSRFFHAQQTFRYILQKTSRRSAYSAMTAFFKSEAGSSMKSGGDLCVAYLSGLMVDAMYTFRLGVGGGGSPSYFFTESGLRELLRVLPDQNEAARAMVLKCLDACDSSLPIPSIFEPQSATASNEDEDDEVMEEIFTSGCRNGGAEPVVTQQTLYDNRIAMYRAFADSEVLRAQKDACMETKYAELKAKDAELKVKDAEIRSKESALRHKEEVCALQLQHSAELREMEKRLGDAEVARLKEKLAAYEQGAGRSRLERKTPGKKRPVAQNAAEEGVGAHSEEEEDDTPQPKTTKGSSRARWARPSDKELFSSSEIRQRKLFFVMYEADSALTEQQLADFFVMEKFASAQHANGKWVSVIQTATKRRSTKFVWFMRSLHEKGLVRSAWVDCRSGDELDIPDGLFETVRARKVLMRQMV